MLSLVALNASEMNVLRSANVPPVGNVTPGALWQVGPGVLSGASAPRCAAQIVSQSSAPLVVTPVGTVLACASPSSWKNLVLWTANAGIAAYTARTMNAAKIAKNDR